GIWTTRHGGRGCWRATEFSPAACFSGDSGHTRLPAGRIKCDLSPVEIIPASVYPACRQIHQYWLLVYIVTIYHSDHIPACWRALTRRSKHHGIPFPGICKLCRPGFLPGDLPVTGQYCG